MRCSGEEKLAKPFSRGSPIDSAGNFYGLLTISNYNPQQVRSFNVLQWLSAAVSTE